MTKEEVYEFIDELALCLYSKKITLSLSALNVILKDRNVIYSSNRGSASGLCGAYRYWETKDPVFHHAFAYIYNDKKGKPVWMNTHVVFERFNKD
jgi:hypothetical protein